MAEIVISFCGPCDAAVGHKKGGVCLFGAIRIGARRPDQFGPGNPSIAQPVAASDAFEDSSRRKMSFPNRPSALSAAARKLGLERLGFG